MSSLVIGLCVVAVSVALVIPTLFSWNTEDATSAPARTRGSRVTGQTPLSPVPTSASVSLLRRFGSAVGLLAVVLGTAMAIAAVCGLALLVLGVVLG